MENPQATLATHGSLNFMHLPRTSASSSVSTSPDHSRARSKKVRTLDQSSDQTQTRPRIRRRESYTDGTRRGRSRTRSLSPGPGKRRKVRRRSRSPSRSCGNDTTDTEKHDLETPKSNEEDAAGAENRGRSPTELLIRDGRQESMRSRSKKRKKYRRRSDYAAAVDEEGTQADLPSLRARARKEDAKQQEQVGRQRRTRRGQAVESVIEED